MRTIRIIDKVITKFCSGMLILLSSVMIISAFLQVATRVILKNSFGWTDELCRYAMVWLALFAGGMAVKENAHVSVNLLRERCSGKTLAILLKFISALTLIFAIVITWYGRALMFRNMKQVTTGLHLPMGLVYACLPLGGIVMIFYSFLQLTGLQEKL